MSSRKCESCSGDGGGSSNLCPLSLGLFAASAAAFTSLVVYRANNNDKMRSGEERVIRVVFVLGGPGSGKGTQCSLLCERLPHWTHLSAGDLLRSERRSGSSLAALINSHIADGRIVPAEITVSLLENAMKRSPHDDNFLIDGFPRSRDNVTVWNESPFLSSCVTLPFVLFLDCPEDAMTSRLLDRGTTSGRNDDNLDVIRKRFHTFRNDSYPIVQMYDKLHMLHTIPADRSVDDVHASILSLFHDL